MASPVGNFSYAWAGAVANDAAAGDVAITNPNNASGQANGVYATCALGAGQSSQYAKATTFSFYPPIPTTATIRGFAFVTKGSDNAAASLAVNTEVKLIKGGAISGSNLADGQPFSSAITNNSQNPMPMIGKSGTELGGLTFTAADITADTNFGVAWRWSATGAVTLSLDAMGIIVYWTDTPEAVITATTPTTRLVGEVIGAHAIDSVIGLNRWERTRVRWKLTGCPVGFSTTTADPRRGDDVDGETRNWATDVKGRVYGVQATHAGNYTLMCYIDCEDGTTLVSNEIVFTVAARSAGTYHVKPSTGNNGNTGLSEAQAWQTFAYAVANAPTGSKVLLYDDQTFTPGASTPTISTDNLHFTRSGTGAAKPVFEISTGQAVAALTGDDLIFENINFGDNAARLAGVTKPYIFTLSNVKRLVVTGCEGDGWLSLAEISTSTSNEAFWLCNNPDLGGFLRYFIYAGGTDSRYMVVAGNTSSGNSTTGGESWARFEASSSGGYGMGANVFWNDVTSTRPAGAVTYTAANPTVVTQASHGLITGNSVSFSGSTGTSINGSRAVTVVDANTFTVAVNVATPGSATMYTTPQVFVRPGWSHIDVWENRVDDLSFNVAESHDSNNCGFQISNRFIANDITVQGNPNAPGFMGGVNQRNSIATLCANNYLEECVLLMSFDIDDGDTYWLSFINNTSTNTTNLTENVVVEAKSGEGWYPWGFQFLNNLWIVDASWGAFNLADAVSPTWIDAARDVSIGGNVYRRNGTAGQVRFKIANTNALLATWNALDAVAPDDNYELTITNGDITAANNWLPDAAFTVARGNGVPIDGIFDDYVGSNRDPEAATWSAGATGGDPIAAPTLVYQSSEIGTAHATQATFGWTAAAGVTNYRLKYGTASGIYTLNAEAAAVTVDLSGLTPSTTYYGVVVSVKDGVESEPTDEFQFTTGPEGAPQTDGSRINLTSGSNRTTSGNAWSNPDRVDGPDSGDFANVSLTNQISDALTGTLPATELEGVLVGAKFGVKGYTAAAPDATATFSFSLGNVAQGIGGSTNGDPLPPTTTETEYEVDVVLTQGTWAGLQAALAAGMTAGVGESLSVVALNSGLTPTDFRVTEVWLVPVLAGASSGGASVAAVSVRGRGRGRMRMRGAWG